MYPAYSILTYFKEPELSLSSGVAPPPYAVSADDGIPSILFIPPLILKDPLPNKITPPQSPLLLFPIVFPDVKTIGLAAVPSAISLAPLVINKPAPAAVLRIITPASIVSVALFFT